MPNWLIPHKYSSGKLCSKLDHLLPNLLPVLRSLLYIFLQGTVTIGQNNNQNNNQNKVQKSLKMEENFPKDIYSNDLFLILKTNSTACDSEMKVQPQNAHSVSLPLKWEVKFLGVNFSVSCPAPSLFLLI